MAISVRCSECKTEFKLGIRICPKCEDKSQANRRYKVIVKLQNGTWFKKQCDNLVEAKKLERKVRSDDFENKYFQRVQAKTFEEVWSMYLDWAKASKVSWKDDESGWRLYLSRTFSKRPMDSVTPTDIEKVLNSMRTSKNRYGRPYKPESIHKVFKVIRRLYNWAAERELFVGRNPCDAIKFPAYDNRVTDYLTKEEIDRLLKVLSNWENKRAALVVSYALFSGRRKSEILKLKWSDIDRTLWVVSYQGVNSKNRTTQVLPLNTMCKAVIAEAHALSEGEYVFPNSLGQPYTASGFDTIWKRIRDTAGIKKRFHGLRHTFATFLASSGEVNLYHLQKLLGHKSFDMVQRYASLADDSLRHAADVASRMAKDTPA